MSLGLIGQELYKPYSFPTLYPKAYEINTIDNNFSLDSKVDTESNEYIDALFKERSAFTRRVLHEKGEVYFNFPEVENYLNKVLSRLVPDKLNRTDYKVYAARSTNPNAYSFEDGSIYFNIGLLAELESADALALILGHELAHIISQDQSESFNIQVNSNSSSDDSQQMDISDGVFHRNEILELKADSLGYELAIASGYSGDAFENIVDILREKYERSATASTYPDWEKRSTQFRKLNITQDRVDLRIDQDFQELIKVAKYETLELLLERNQYEEALEKALSYHLADKKDDTYVYYAYENLRRFLLVNPELYKESITLKQKDINQKQNSTYLANDLRSLDTAIDNPNSTVIAYREIEHYFENLCVSRNISESKLSQALFLHQKTEFEKRNQVLVDYLNSGSIRNRKFAEYLLRPHTYLNADVKDAVIVNDINFLRRNAFGYRNVSEANVKSNEKYFKSISKMVKRRFSNKEVLSLRELTRMNFNDAVALSHSLSDIKYLREILINSKQSNVSDLFILSPKHFKVFKLYGINAFEYVDIISMDRSLYPENKLVMTNPINWIKRLNYLYFAGSTKHKYSVAYYAFKPYSENKFNFYRSIVKYKLTKSNLLNTVYQALNQSSNA